MKRRTISSGWLGVDGSGMNDGGVQVYEIPYRGMLFERSQTQNLLVPVCVSATHVAYSSLRMSRNT